MRNYASRKAHNPELHDLGLSHAQYVNQTRHHDNYLVRQLTGVLPTIFEGTYIDGKYHSVKFSERANPSIRLQSITLQRYPTIS